MRPAAEALGGWQQWKLGARVGFALALHAGGLFWVIALLAHWASAESLGHYVLGYAISAPVFMFLGARQRLLLVSYIGESDPTWMLVRTRVVTSIVGVLCIAGFSAAVWAETDPAKATVITLVASAKAAEAMSDISYGGLQRAGDVNAPAWSMGTRALVSAAAAGCVVPLTESAVAAAAVVFMVWAIWAILDLRRLARRCPLGSLREPMAISAVRALRTTATHPLALVTLLGSLAYYLPRYYLEVTSSDSTLGYFGALSYFGLAMLMLGHAVSDSAMPSLAQRHQHQLGSYAYLRDVRRLYALLIVAGSVSVLGVLALGEPVLALVLGAEYSQFVHLAALLVTASTFLALVNCQAYALVALGLSHQQLLGTGLCFTILLVACSALIPAFGMLGAALADIIFALLSFVVMETLLHRRVNAKRPNP